MDNKNSILITTQPKTPRPPQPIPALNSAGVPTPQQSGEKDIFDAIAKADQPPPVFGEPPITSQAFERSPSRSDAEKRRAKESRKAAKRENRDKSPPSEETTTGWLSEFRKRRESASRRITRRFYRPKLADGMFDEPENANQERIFEGKEADGEQNLAGPEVEGTNLAREGTLQKFRTRLERAFSRGGTGRP